MEPKNLLAIIVSNFRLNVKRTVFPAVLILSVIPLVYGTSHLDSVKSADCLERMAALVGIPMFVPLLKPEQGGGMDAILILRPFPHRITAVLRVGLSLVLTTALLLSFEGYMRMGGCSFPVCIYTFRALAAAMVLGFTGLLASAVSKNTVVGFFVSFCWYLVLQTGDIGAVFRSVSNGISVYQILLLSGCTAAVIFFSGAAFGGKGE